MPGTVYAKTPDFDDKMAAGRATFADSGWADAMDKYLELQKRGFFNDNPNGTTYEQQTSMVATGKAAMAVQVSAVLQAFREAAPIPGRPGHVPVPGQRRRGGQLDPGGRRRRSRRVSAKAKNADQGARSSSSSSASRRTSTPGPTAVAAIPLHARRDAPRSTRC